MMTETETDLRRFNERLAAEENVGNRPFFEDRLAPVFVLKRANGEIQDRETFLRLLQPGGQRVCDPKSIQIVSLGLSRALVTCLVRIGEKSIHNARLFALSEGKWQMLAWANEWIQEPGTAAAAKNIERRP